MAVTEPAQPAAQVPTTEPPGGTAPRRARGIAVGLLLGVAVVIVAADALGKQLALTHLTDRDPVRVLGGVLYLDVTRNGGAAFSLGTRYTIVFPIVTVVVATWIGWMASRLRSLPWAAALGLVLGGALGNFADRLLRAPGFLVGHVVDYLSLFGPNGAHWPIFNIADAALSCGVVLAVLLELTGRRRDGGRVRQTGRRDQS